MSSTAGMTNAPAVVIDASALLEVINHGPLAPALERRLTDIRLHAPALIDLEVLHTLRRKVFGNSLSLEQAESAIAEYGHLRIEGTRTTISSTESGSSA